MLFSRRIFRPASHLAKQAINGKVRVSDVAKVCYSSSANPPYWDYTKKHGPSSWERNWKTNKRQSPIDILTKQAKYDPNLKKFEIDETPVAIKLNNFGLNVSITPNDSKEIQLTGGALKHPYLFREFHFHWGNQNTCGCEHTLNGHRFAAELHIVHWNRGLYDSEQTALSSQDGLAVLGVFLEAKQTYESNVDLDALLEKFQYVKYKNAVHDSETLYSPYSLLPMNRDEYFTYPGSLTTPPLTENVTWTIFRSPLKISTRQLQEFNELCAVPEEEKDKSHSVDFFNRETPGVPQPPTITNNFRPTQPKFYRVVSASFDVTK